MISALIITKNEEANIGECLVSLKDVVDEIVVLDSGSEDKTREIAEQLGARVIETTWEGYAATKNKGADHCKQDYILSIDADEALSEELAQSIKKACESGLKGAYLLDRHNYYLGKWIRTCGWYPDWKIRLYRKTDARWTGDYVHEKLTINDNVQTTKLTGSLHHYSVQSLNQHRQTVEKYARLAAEKQKNQGRKGNLLKGGLSFAITFLRIYLVQLGITEGKRGFYIAYYSALSKWWRQVYMKRF